MLFEVDAYRSRIVGVEGERRTLRETYVATIRYAKRRVASITTRTKTQLGSLLWLDGSKPTYKTSVFELAWEYDRDKARVTAKIDG